MIVARLEVQRGQQGRAENCFHKFHQARLRLKRRPDKPESALRRSSAACSRMAVLAPVVRAVRSLRQ